MKKLIFMAAFAVATLTATAQEPSKTLYLVNGEPTTKEVVDQLPPEQIKNMNVMRGVESVVLITTHANNKPELDNVVVVRCPKQTQSKDESISISSSIDGEEATVEIDEKLKGTTVRVRQVKIGKDGKKVSASADDPLFVVKFPDGTVQGGGQISDFKPENIRAITVYKDNKNTEQFKQYGDTSKGVIYIELK